MKNKNLIRIKVVIFLAAFVFSHSFAQNHWRTTGNATTGTSPDNITANNILGTITPGIPLNIYTGGNTAGYKRMFIADGGTGAGTGFIAIGNNFTSPNSVLHVNSINNVTGEVFRTTSPVANTAAWRMLTGTGTTAEKFAVILNV